MLTPNVTHWNHQKSETLLAKDWNNPIRVYSARVIDKVFSGAPITIAEVGPGNGKDYEMFHRSKVLLKNRRYTMYELTPSFAQSLAERFPESEVVLGGFDKMQGCQYDVTYTKDTLEHQPSLEEPLSYFLGAAKRLALISWSILPGADEKIFINPAHGIHENHYRRDKVFSLIEQSNFSVLETKIVMFNGYRWELFIAERAGK